MLYERDNCMKKDSSKAIPNKLNHTTKEVKNQDKNTESREDFSVLGYKPSHGMKNLYDVLEAFVYAIIAVIVIFTFFARLTVVDGPSMDTTLKHGDYLIVANVFFTYEPENGDIVVVHGDFKNYYEGIYKNEKHEIYHNYSDPIVKRVIATEGQEIKIDYGTMTVYVDGKKLNEPYAQYLLTPQDRLFLGRVPTLGEYRYDENGDVIKDKDGNAVYYPYYNSKTGVFTAVVPENHVFVMGDNRDNSADSRLMEIGFVPEEFIVGKAVFRLAPFSKMGGLD